jgi:hypothetical protein
VPLDACHCQCCATMLDIQLAPNFVSAKKCFDLYITPVKVVFIHHILSVPLSQRCPEAHDISCRFYVCGCDTKPLSFGLRSQSHIRPQHPPPVFSFRQLRYGCFLLVFHLFLMLILIMIPASGWCQSAWLLL